VQRSREEEEKKNHKAKAAELVQQATGMYNTNFLELCDTAVIVATYHEMLRDDGVRLPGARREALRQRAQAEGLEVADALVAQWRGPLQPGPPAAS
jgi:LDH2 family malate/lactate/ureidoglycolate dehydrogenase